jgi:hypothetical protein
MKGLWRVYILIFLGAIVTNNHAYGERFVFEEEFVVEGEVQKPEVTVVVSRENLNKAYVFELEETFLSKIIQSVESEPF